MLHVTIKNMIFEYMLNCFDTIYTVTLTALSALTKQQYTSSDTFVCYVKSVFGLTASKVHHLENKNFLTTFLV